MAFNDDWEQWEQLTISTKSSVAIWFAGIWVDHGGIDINATNNKTNLNHFLWILLEQKKENIKQYKSEKRSIFLWFIWNK